MCTLLSLIVQVTITSSEIRTTSCIDSHGLVMKVQGQRSQPRVNLCHGASTEVVAGGEEQVSQCPETIHVLQVWYLWCL